MRIQLLKDIHSKLLSEIIDYKDAYKQIKSLSKPWTSKDWKLQREKLIKDYCEICNTKTGPFVLQHIKHPQNFSRIYDEISQRLMNETIPDYPTILEKETQRLLDVEISTGYEMRECCPICGTLGIRSRKLMTPKYICKFNHQFDNKTTSKYYIKSQTTNVDVAKSKSYPILKSIANYKIRKMFSKEFDSMIGRIALLISIDESIEYLEMKYTKTYCKKCAFKADLPYVVQKQLKELEI